MTSPFAVVRVIVAVAKRYAPSWATICRDETGTSLCFSGGQINVGGGTVDQTLFESAEMSGGGCSMNPDIVGFIELARLGRIRRVSSGSGLS